MKRIFWTIIQIVIASILSITIVVGMTVLFALKPDFYNEPVQFLLGVILTAVSVWLGAVISTRKAEKNAMAKWLPAAEMVCNELLTTSAFIERMCRKQSNGIERSVQVLLPSSMSKDKATPIIEHIYTRCGYCTENFENLKNHVENSYLNWNILIQSNGEQNEVQEIQKRLIERRESLFSAIERDFPSTQNGDGGAEKKQKEPLVLNQ